MLLPVATCTVGCCAVVRIRDILGCLVEICGRGLCCPPCVVQFCRAVNYACTQNMTVGRRGRIPTPAAFLPAAAGMMPVPAQIPVGAIVGDAEVTGAVPYEFEVGRRGRKRRIGDITVADAGAIAEAAIASNRVRARDHGLGGPVLPQDSLQVR